jgi:hypothetical protein
MDKLTVPRAPKEMIETTVASCKGQASATRSAAPQGATIKTGYARDQSLSYSYVVQPNNARSIEVTYWNGEANETAVSDQVAPQ